MLLVYLLVAFWHSIFTCFYFRLVFARDGFTFRFLNPKCEKPMLWTVIHSILRLPEREAGSISRQIGAETNLPRSWPFFKKACKVTHQSLCAKLSPLTDFEADFFRASLFKKIKTSKKCISEKFNGKEKRGNWWGEGLKRIKIKS